MFNVTNDIICIGVNDHDIDLFEGQYIVPNGMSYNSYAIMDEHIAVMDTVDAHFTQEWLNNLDAALGGRKPDYLIVQHMEPDHSSNIVSFINAYPEAKIVGNAKTFAMIDNFFDVELEGKKLVVANGESLPLGEHTLTFVFAPMVHWPEVMVTYDQKDKVLFSADGFGKFGALDVEEEWDCEARRYYIGIVGKYGAPAKLVLEKAKKLDIKTVCALHGPILQGELLAEALRLYTIWTGYGVETEGVFVVYGSLHGNTAKAAEKLVEILQAKGCPKVACADLSEEDFHECIEDAFRYGRVIFAAPTYEGGVFPKMEQLLTHLAHKCWQGKKVGLVENGSWAPAAARTMRAALERMKDITIVEPSVTIKGALKTSDISALEALADAILA